MIKLGMTLCILNFASLAYAWGEHGHHAVCNVASKLVSEPELYRFLLKKGHQLGHLCNIPDIAWRSAQAKAGSNPQEIERFKRAKAVADSAHFNNIRLLGFELRSVPSNLVSILRDWQSKIIPMPYIKDPSPVDIPIHVGTLWWRYQQFISASVEAGKKLNTEAKDSPGQQRNLFDWFSNLAVAGHFIGDAGQPYHNNPDHDGWAKGHGGIHAYYERDVVQMLGFNLDYEVYQYAKKHASDEFKDFEAVAEDPFEMIRRVSVLSSMERHKVESLDRITAPSTMEFDDQGNLKLKFDLQAQRPEASETAEDFRAIATSQLARSAYALAKTWDAAYRKIGKPDLSAFYGMDYILDLPFTEVNYLPY